MTIFVCFRMQSVGLVGYLPQTRIASVASTSQQWYVKHRKNQVDDRKNSKIKPSSRDM